MSASDRREERLVTMLVILTIVTGIVDSVSYLRLGHVFVANMTGNVVFSALPPPAHPESMPMHRSWPSQRLFAARDSAYSRWRPAEAIGSPQSAQ